MAIPAPKAHLLDCLAEELSHVSGVLAVALGGSHARGTETPHSDLDIGLYYREAAAFRIDDIREIARRYSASGSPTVSDFYGWGPFVNGGAWIDNTVCKIDFLYRNLDQLEQIVADARRGEWTHSYDQHPPFGFRSVTTLGEIHCCRPLYDPDDILGALKAEVATFPPALKARIVQDSLGCAEFAFFFTRDAAASGDVPNAVASMTRIYHYLVQALFALNETYIVNDKRVFGEIDRFPLKPDRFGERLRAVLAAPGATPAALLASVGEFEMLFAETAALTDGAYRSKFGIG